VGLEVGPWSKYGLQTPKGSPISMHPTLNTSILASLRDGAVSARPAITRFDGRSVHFNDGSTDRFDTIIWATGYRIGYSFLDDAIIAPDFLNAPPLYLTMMHPRMENLFFIGLFQPMGCIWRLADYQARIAALQIKGVLKPPADVAARGAAEVSARRKRFGTAPRHLLEVDYHDFRRALLRELGDHAEVGR
jgi:cation diffusion facilitator CzcD-associated flavoprotein CzcO